jgi:hypothetical protein
MAQTKGATATASATASTQVIGLLGMAFIILKLTGVITWSWLWVLAPFWALPALALLAFAVAGVLWLLSKVIK